MRVRKQIEIDGVSYDVGPVRPTVALKLMTKITKILGPSITGLLSGDGAKDVKKSILDAKRDGEDVEGDSFLDKDIDLSKVFNEFFDRLHEDEVEKVALTLLSETLHQGRQGEKGIGKIDSLTKFDIAFADEGLLHAFSVCKVCFEVTYGDFFGEGGVFKKAMAEGMGRLRLK